MIIIQYFYRDNIIATAPVNMEFNKQNCELVRMQIKKGLVEKPKKYDSFELYKVGLRA